MFRLFVFVDVIKPVILFTHLKSRSNNFELMKTLSWVARNLSNTKRIKIVEDKVEAHNYRRNFQFRYIKFMLLNINVNYDIKEWWQNLSNCSHQVITCSKSLKRPFNKSCIILLLVFKKLTLSNISN